MDSNDLKKQKLPLLSRFEKHIMIIEVLLEDEDKKKSKKLMNFYKN